jgi:hypothetical protein
MGPQLRTALVAMVLPLALSACGDDGDRRSPPALPDDAVAVVGDREIGRDDLDEEMASQRRLHPRTMARIRELARDDPALLRVENRRLRNEALSMLMQAAALEQEAAERGVEVTTAEARERWDTLTGTQFRSPKARRAFLRGQIAKDLVAQMRLQMLSSEIYAQVAREAGGGRDGSRRFQTEFRKRWQGQTVCRKGFDAEDCPTPAN